MIRTRGLPLVVTLLFLFVGLNSLCHDVRAASPKIKIDTDNAIELSEPRTYRLQVVIRVDAPNGPVTNVVAQSPIPIEWQEQKLRLIEEKISPGARVKVSVIKGRAGMLELRAKRIRQGEFVSVERLYEVTRYHMRFVTPPEELVFAKRRTSSLREHLTAKDPGIELKHQAFVKLARQLKKDDAPAWDTVQEFWSWTRDNVTFTRGEYRGALHAMETRCGDCEEMSVLFISLCRIAGIPSRSVWVEGVPEQGVAGHSYPEFYLNDAEGKGHWIPCQVLGPPWFGEMVEYRPIFQKGDGFFDPLQKKYVRYAPQSLRADGGGAAPKLTIEHNIIADSDINGPGYNNPE